uniref:Palmitoyltransferase n=1 Tax=Palpitomonas bilix TaxID=652834 RepID=A0A7S3GI84_9EUKA|mmetsp:Transcript_50364/g.129724  ORF Transcript_50364/g.129724 Transcript_50364/m.129724 type:complete len:657 (+) Transcript_50364:150-2120(+)
MAESEAGQSRRVEGEGESKENVAKKEKTNSEQTLLPGSYVCAEKGYCRLVSGQRTLRGHWKGKVSFDPLPPSGVGSDVLDEVDMRGATEGLTVMRMENGGRVVGYLDNNTLDGYCTVVQKHGEKQVTTEGNFMKGVIHGPVKTTTVEKGKSVSRKYSIYLHGKVMQSGVWVLTLCLPVLLICAIGRMRGRYLQKEVDSLGKELSAGKHAFQGKAAITSKKPAPLRPVPIFAYLRGVVLPILVLAYLIVVEQWTPTWHAHLFGVAGVLFYVSLFQLEKYFCGTRLIKASPAQMLYVATTILTGLIFYIYRVVGRYSYVADAVFIVNVIFMYIFFFYVKFAPPGYLPKYDSMTKEEAKEVEKKLGLRFRHVCETCGIIRPLRAKHCKDCDKCVDHFDHHCPFFNCCIGSDNRYVFLLFLWDFALCQLILFHNLWRTASMSITDEEWADSECPISMRCIGMMIERDFSLFGCFVWNSLHFFYHINLLSMMTNLVVSNITTNESFNWKRFVYLQTPIWTRVDEYLIPDEDMQLESGASNGKDIVEVWRENRKKMKEEAEMILKTEDGKEMVEIENNIAEYLGKVEKNKQESKDKEDKVGKDSCPFPTMKHFYLRRKCIVEEARTAPFYLGSAKANFAYVKNPVHFKVERSPTLDELKKRE